MTNSEKEGAEYGWDKKTIALAAFILFGSGSGIGNYFLPQLRSGSFTEADFEREKAMIIKHIHEVEYRDEVMMDGLRKRITILEERIMECRRRISECEKK